MDEIKKYYDRVPEGCHPGKGCFSCKYKDCVFCGPVKPQESEITSAGEVAKQTRNPPRNKCNMDCLNCKLLASKCKGGSNKAATPWKGANKQKELPYEGKYSSRISHRVSRKGNVYE